MTEGELLGDVLHRNIEMLTSTLEDFSDADMLVRPVPAANHAAWQLGHLVNAETGMLRGLGAEAPALPPGFDGKFTKETASIDDPAYFPKKKELIDAMISVRAASVAWAKTLTSADMSKPAPERMRAWVPTVGHLAHMFPGHLTMHVGQFQVIRRKLGKPILF